jgi:hypothetical protein
MGDIDDFHQAEYQSKTGRNEKKQHAEGKCVERLDNPESH